MAKEIIRKTKKKQHVLINKNKIRQRENWDNKQKKKPIVLYHDAFNFTVDEWLGFSQSLLEK